MTYPTEEDVRMSLPQDLTCFHGTGPQLHLFYPTPLSLSVSLPPLSVVPPFKSYRTFAEGPLFLLHVSQITSVLYLSITVPVRLPPLWPSASSLTILLASLSPSFSLSLFFSSCSAARPSPADIWANNQCHFIPVREQMDFQLRAWQQAMNKDFSVTLTPSLTPPSHQNPSVYQVLLQNLSQLWLFCHLHILSLENIWFPVSISLRRYPFMSGFMRSDDHLEQSLRILADHLQRRANLPRNWLDLATAWSFIFRNSKWNIENKFWCQQLRQRQLKRIIGWITKVKDLLATSSLSALTYIPCVF